MKMWPAICTGFLCGTVGVHLLTSREAKTVYSYLTAAVLHGRDDIVEQAQILSENCGDIYQRAKEINEKAQAFEEASMIRNAKKTEPEEKTQS